MKSQRFCFLFSFCSVFQVSLSVTFLQQSDFDDGSYIISQPGEYRLSEDITFNPLYSPNVLETTPPELILFPTEQQRSNGSQYSTRAYALGFFAAIVCQSDGVIVDLNQFTLSQGVLHGASQRFFALIELSSSPFPPRAGPANFSASSQFIASTNVTIKNGRLGRTSHHAIHGNHNEGILLQDLTISDFEVVGISLNQVSNLRIESVDIQDSQRSIPVNGHFSQAIFGLQALSVHLALDAENLKAESQELLKAQAALRESVKLVFNQIEDGTPVSNPLFASLTSGLPDGSLVGGILLNPKVFVGDMLQADYNVSGIFIKDVNIRNLSISPIEQSTLLLSNPSSPGYDGTHIRDNVGAVFPIDLCYSMETGRYVPNVLTDFQIALAAYGHACLQSTTSSCLDKPGAESLLRRNKIPPQLVEWARGKIDGENFLDLYFFKSNADYMFHTNKGAIGLKIAGAVNLAVENVNIDTLENHATYDNRGYFVRDSPDYTGFQIKGVSLSSSANVTGNIKTDRLFALSFGEISNIDYLNDVKASRIELEDSKFPSERGVLLGQLEKVDRVLPFVDSSCAAGAADSKGKGFFDDSSSLAVILSASAIALIAFASILFVYSKQRKEQNILEPKHYSDMRL